MEYAGNLSGIEVFQMGFLTIKEDTKEHGRKGYNTLQIRYCKVKRLIDKRQSG